MSLVVSRTNSTFITVKLSTYQGILMIFSLLEFMSLSIEEDKGLSVYATHCGTSVYASIFQSRILNPL